jgi:hypothetical protein
MHGKSERRPVGQIVSGHGIDCVEFRVTPLIVRIGGSFICILAVVITEIV